MRLRVFGVTGHRVCLHSAVPGLATLLLAFLVFLSATSAAADLSRVPAQTWVTNGAVRAVLPIRDRVYIGGSFTYVGRLTGSGAPLSRATGLPLTGFAAVDGSVYAAAPDGAGGYYIGGDFTTVGGVARSRLAHLLADGTVDAAWNPPDITATTGGVDVRTLAVSGATVYVGGSFTSVGGQPRYEFAGLDARTGVLTGWNPNAQFVPACATCSPSNPAAYSLVVSGDAVYLSGDFNRIGGQPRDGLAAVDAQTGAVSDWNPRGGGVYAIVPAGQTVYVGGAFHRIGGQARNSIAALDASTGAASAWNPNAKLPYDTASVRALAVSGDTVYVGGQFTSIGGSRRISIAALSARTGAATGWNPNPKVLQPGTDVPESESSVSALVVSGSTVYAGGYFALIGGRPRTNVAGLDTRTGTATAWQPGASDSVLALAVSGSTVYAGGGFESVGGVERSNIAAVDARTGAATSWNPWAEPTVSRMATSPRGTVYVLASRGRWIYAGGDFTRIGGRARNHLAAVSISTGAAGAWNPNANGAVYAMAISRSGIYVGGDFTRIGHVRRNHIARLAPGTGKPTAWNPGANGDVLAVAISRARVYAGGTFTQIGGRARSLIAALDTATGRAAAWNPHATCNSTDETGQKGCDDGGESVVPPGVSALAASGSRLYVGGSFERIGRKTRTNIAAIDARTGHATAWRPRGDFEHRFGPGQSVSALAVSGSTIYIGGSALAAFSTRTGKQTWTPEGSFRTLALAAAKSRLYTGGDGMDIKNPFSTISFGASLYVSGYSAAFGSLNTPR